MIDHTDSDETNSGEKDFQLGLTMSGAISGGAYTAGVFDFLIQALHEWEKAREGEDKANVPTHRVGIKVMSGASAGAMTAAIGIMALADGKQQPQEFQSPQQGKQRIKCYLPRLYKAWVVQPALYANDVRSANKNCVSDAKKSIPPDFLCTSDVDKKAKGGKLEIDFSHTTGCTEDSPAAPGAPLSVVSLLNAQLLDRITQEALAIPSSLYAPLRPYIAKTLHIYMTLSNLRGVPWKVKFEGGDYEMISHGDRVHYAISGLGSWDGRSDFGERDQKRDIQVSDLDEAKPDHFKWKDFSIFALASGAFPVGLAPRTLSATLGKINGPDGYKGEYEGRLFPIDSLAGRNKDINPSFPQPSIDAPSFTFRTADGGIIDNDPFEYARFCLKTKDELDSGSQDPSKRLPEYVDHAVIMISPFPATGAIAPENQPAPDILSIFSALMPSLIDQVRFKPSELVLAADESYGSRYLIGPVRVFPETNGKEKQARYPIASGLLGGFGGFVAQSFRDHDFQLGRRNCQWFLQTNFAVPAEKSSIAHGYKKGLNLEKFKALDTNSHKPKDDELVILPLFGTALGEVPLPDWPQIGKVEFDELQSQIAIRFDAVAPALLAANVKDNLLWLLLRIALIAPFGKTFGPVGIIREKALNYLKLTMLADLVRRNQIEGWDFGASPGLDPDDIRLILGELLNPAYDLRNVAGLAKSTNLGTLKVIEIISFLEAAGAKGGDAPYKIRISPKKDNDGSSLYTLASRKPGLSETLNDVFGGTKLEALLTQPRVDPPGL